MAEVPCRFVDAPTAGALAIARSLSEAALAAEISAYVVTRDAWSRITSEVVGQDVPSLLFTRALGGIVQASKILYTFDGQQPCGAHVDEVPEDLLGLKHYGMFNIHEVVSGAITACTVHTRPGYYTQEVASRVPQTRFNFGITQDLMRRKQINSYTTSDQISEARLQTGDRIIFFERTSPTVDGPPNVVHLFHRGTVDRHSETSRFFVRA